MHATALFYGLKTDTNGLLRSTNKADLEAFNYLFPKIAPKTLASIENPRIPKVLLSEVRRRHQQLNPVRRCDNLPDG